jgi:hypothetical protein
LTKPLGRTRFQELCGKVGIVDTQFARQGWGGDCWLNPCSLTSLNLRLVLCFSVSSVSSGLALSRFPVLARNHPSAFCASSWPSRSSCSAHLGSWDGTISSGARRPCFPFCNRWIKGREWEKLQRQYAAQKTCLVFILSLLCSFSRSR